MKAIHKIISLSAAMSLAMFSCDPNDGIVEANISVVNPATYSANFFFINASVDGPSLDFFVNGVNQGSAPLASAISGGYKNVPITTPGLNNIANTSIRAKATSGTIGGLIGSNDLLFRATNTGIGNLVAVPNARYTFIAVDELNRPVPQRTFSINTITNALAADITYYNRATKAQITNDAYKALSAADQANFVSIGTVPAGTTDPGGIRYYALTDTYPTDANIAAAVTGNLSFVRFVHASANAPGVFVRLVPTAGSNVNLVTTAATNVMAVSNFNPSVGSRSATVAFATTGNVPSNTYTVEIHTNATFTALAASAPNVTFAAGKIYTLVARGLVGGTGASALGICVGQHN
jgi:hypothetical protein